MAFTKDLFKTTKFPQRLGIDRIKLDLFIEEVSRHYLDNSYHNLYHAVDTTNTLAWMLFLPTLRENIPPLHGFILMVAALCHDLEHPGRDNNWEVNIRSDRAQRYDFRAVLENHSLDETLRLMEEPRMDFLAPLTEESRLEARTLLGHAILATDFAQHRAFLDDLGKTLSKPWSFADTDFLLLVERCLLKAADISNPGKDFQQAKQWADRVIQEFLAQGQMEKKHNLPVGMLNDREKVELHAAQAGFIKIQVLELFQLLAKVEPGVGEIVASLAHNQTTYEQEAARIKATAAVS
ncbi:MAG: 3',5'-cyclic nucleotide phosphodiesterase [Deltaproteobacteria bacterium]|nr:3',5'-cyclic nucleotide phosphodiesterase [Deltaproteobacteria bacterium]